MSRHSFTDGVIEFVKAHEGEWLDAIRFEQFGRQAWRTRISDARKRLEASRQGTIENRVLKVRRVVVMDGQECHAGFYKRSQYRFVRARPVSLLKQMEQPSL